MFAIIYAITTRKKNVFNSKISKKSLKFENLFFKKKINILFIFKRKNYIIKVENNKKSLYKKCFCDDFVVIKTFLN